MSDAEHIGPPNVGDQARFANRERQKNWIFCQICLLRRQFYGFFARFMACMHIDAFL